MAKLSVNLCSATLMIVGRKSLLKHLNSNGPVPRMHGNTGRKPSHAVKYEDVRFCVDFLLLYAEINGLTMPAAPRGADEAAPVLLPCNTTKVDLHSKYQQACVEAGVRILGITTFKCVWKQCLPHIKIMTVKDDVCHKCEMIRKRVADAIHEVDKLEAANALREHIQDAQRDRQVYRQTIEEAHRQTIEEAREEMRHTPITIILVSCGHIKKLYRRTDCDSILQVASVVRKSASSSFPVLFRKKDICQNWTWYGWKTFLPRFFLPLRGIQSYHAFRITKDAIYVKERSTDVEQRVTILKRNATVLEDILPAVLLPDGLSRARQQYLYKNVQPFVRQAYRDVKCPPLREE